MNSERPDRCHHYLKGSYLYKFSDDNLPLVGLLPNIVTKRSICVRTVNLPLSVV